MGTIAEKLSYLADTKDLFKDRLNSLGAEITSATTFRNYLNWLDTFYGEVSDKTNLSQNGVVGRTSQETTTGKNLAIFEQPDTTISGLTIIYDNATGKISIKGKATATTGVRVSKQMQTNIPSGTYTLSINSALPVLINYVVTDSQNNNTAFRITAGNTSVTNTLSNNGVQASLFVAIENNEQYDLEFYMQLESGSTATSYEPFTNGASPNPDYPQPINNLSGDVAYKVSGKNLFIGNYSQFTNTGGVSNLYDYFKIHDNDEYYTLTMTAKNDFVTGGNTYLGFTGNGGNAAAAVDWVVSGGMGVISKGTTLSITSNKKYISMYSKGANTLKLFTDNFDIQLEKGSTPTTYEPYIEPQTFNIPLGDIELCKIDTYEDKIYSSNGRFYLRKENGKVTLNGSESGWENTYGTNLFDINKFLNSKPFIVGYGLCNYCRYNSVQSGINNALSNGEFALQKYTGNVDAEYSIFIKNTSFNNVNDFKTWLSTHNTIVYYPLSTPTTIEITQENYPSLYNALKQIQDYLTSYKINKEFILGYSSPEIEY